MFLAAQTWRNHLKCDAYYEPRYVVYPKGVNNRGMW